MRDTLERMSSLFYTLASPSTSQNPIGRKSSWLRKALNDDQAQSQSSNPIDAHIEPVFPCELEREIFEIAALSHRPCIVQLTLVARRVQLWMEPFLYSIVVMAVSQAYQYPPLDIFTNGDRVSGKQEKAVLELERIGPYVRQVLLQGVTIPKSRDLLKACPNLHHLALWRMDESEGRFPQLMPILKHLPIRSLSLHLSRFSAPSVLDPRAFQHLTHLFLMNRFVKSWLELKGLALLPKLTHLALSNDRFISQICEECKTLKLVVSFGFQGFHHAHDPRHLILPMALQNWNDNFVDRWEMGARSAAENDKFWAMAEERNRKSLE